MRQPNKISRTVADVLRDPDMQNRLTVRGFEVRGDSCEAVAELIRTSCPKWADVIRRAGIRLAQ